MSTQTVTETTSDHRLPGFYQKQTKRWRPLDGRKIWFTNIILPFLFSPPLSLYTVQFDFRSPTVFTVGYNLTFFQIWLVNFIRRNDSFWLPSYLTIYGRHDCTADDDNDDLKQQNATSVSHFSNTLGRKTESKNISFWKSLFPALGDFFRTSLSDTDLGNPIYIAIYIWVDPYLTVLLLVLPRDFCTRLFVWRAKSFSNRTFCFGYSRWRNGYCFCCRFEKNRFFSSIKSRDVQLLFAESFLDVCAGLWVPSVQKWILTLKSVCRTDYDGDYKHFGFGFIGEWIIIHQWFNGYSWNQHMADVGWGKSTQP